MTLSADTEESIYIPKLAEILQVDVLSATERLYRLQFTDGSHLTHVPGQFVEVSVMGMGEAPISISSSPTRDASFEIGVRTIGNVTHGIHRLHPGDTMGIRGPFGNGFPVPELIGRDLLFVAGGIGVLPLRSMIQYALDKREQFGRIILLYGCRQPAAQLFPEELNRMRNRPDIELLESIDHCPFHVAWHGSVGVITTLFPKVTLEPEKTTALIVGPPVMYRYVAAECLKKGIAKNQILMSLERRMKCGIGLCGHCQINNVYVCQDGPVFSYEELSKLKETEV